MSIICQDVALLTTTTIKTILTVYVSTVLSQAVGRPTPMTSVVVGSSCSAYTSANSSTQRCSTSSSTLTMFLTASPSQVQVPLTITSQIYQTQFNTLIGSSCRTVPAPVPVTQPPSPGPTTPPPQPTTQPTPQRPGLTDTTTQSTPQQPGLTDTTFTTEYVTVTGSRPPDTSPTTILTSNTRRPTTSSLSRSTVYAVPSALDLSSDADPSGTALAQESSSSRLPIAAIAGGAAGGVALIALLALLAYFVLFKKSPKGYERPVGDYINDSYHDSTANSQSGLYPQMQEQAGYHTHDDGLGYSQQYQGNSGAQSLQYSDYVPQSQNAQGLYMDSQSPQFWQQNVVAGASVAALPPGAAAAVLVGRSHRSNSSTASPTSYTSAAPLLSQSLHHQQNSQPPLVPYRGYAEPVDDGRI